MLTVDIDKKTCYLFKGSGRYSLTIYLKYGTALTDSSGNHYSIVPKRNIQLLTFGSNIL